MKPKHFLILAGITGGSLLAATTSLIIGGNTPAFAAAGERLLPQLETAASDVVRVSVRTDDFDMLAELRDGRFVDATSGYPISTEPLKKLVSGLTLAEIAEAKTSDPSRHADLQLAGIDAQAGSGTEVILSDKDGDEIAHVIAGQRDFTLGGLTGGQFVRRGGENASWLVHAHLNPPTTRAGWFDTNLLQVESAQLSTITLASASADAITLNVKDGEASIDSAVLGDRIPAENKLARITGLFESLDFSDVRRAGSAEDEEGDAASETLVTATLKDGTTINITAVEAYEDDGLWVRVVADGSTDVAAELNTGFDGFEFAISSIDAGVFEWTLEDMTEAAPS